MAAATAVLATSGGRMPGFAVFVVALLMPAAPIAQASGVLAGIVTESAGSALPGVIAFLRWEPAARRFVTILGPGYMFPVRGGRVRFGRTDAPGLSDGMPVEEFGRALRALMTSTR
jgi:hypothetical protein